MVTSDDEFDNWLLEDTRTMANQGILDECEDDFVSALDLE